MPRFQFDVRDDCSVLADEEGSKFESMDAAVHAATRSEAEIGTGRLAKGDFRDVVIEVRDEQGERVFTVRASMRVDRHSPSPQGLQNRTV